MSRYVRETAAGKSISAYVVMRGSREVATVQIHHGNSRVLVNVFQHGDSVRRCAKAAGITDERNAYDTFGFQSGTAHGYGYDKTTAALSGLMIDGHKLTDHCGGSRKPPKGKPVFPAGFKAPKGWHMANWSREHEGYTSCFRESGLKYLERLGYRVICAI